MPPEQALGKDERDRGAHACEHAVLRRREAGGEAGRDDHGEDGGGAREPQPDGRRERAERREQRRGRDR